MTFCNFCAKLTVESISDHDVKFHPNLKSLKESAESGCAFCGVCWASVQTSRTPLETITELLNGERPSSYTKNAPWYPSIWLWGQIIPGGDESRVWIMCGRAGPSVPSPDQSETNAGGTPMQVSLRVYALAESAAALRYPGRFIAADPDTSLQVSFIRSRLQECRANHERCEGPEFLKMPTRVIDVGESRPPRLHVTGDMCEPYMALSYCWGPSKDTPKLTHDTFKAFLVELPLALLAKTHQEAIQLARALGFQYLWIDALCIIQGDIDDWAFESRHMEQVYGNAGLTLVAARSADSRLGFSTPNAKQEQQHCPLPLSSSSTDVVYFTPDRRKTTGPTSTRGWCYQEEVLSQRKIIFAENQIAYNCRTGSSWEDGSRSIWNPGETSLRRAFLSDAPDPKVRRQETLAQWYAILYGYTQGNLSNPHDIFAAIASIASLARKNIDSRYLAGLWESDIARGLLWKPKRHIISGPSVPGKRPRSAILSLSTVVRAPSWSWASIEGPIYHRFTTKREASRFNESVKLRPGAENNRWTTDEDCDLETLHIPHRELRVMGKIAKALVLDTSAGDYFRGKDSSSWWGQSIIGKAVRFGVLLADAECMNGEDSTLDDDSRSLDEKVVAIGMFDVAEEATKVVWCLNVTEREGLMLINHGDQWSRVGSFLLERVSWLDSKDDRQVRLI